MLKTCQIAVSKPNKNRLCGSFEGFERVLRGAENVPDSSFEAQ